jgi:carbamoyltransferase
MRVLGLSFSGHGTAACLVEDGRIVRAVNLERITRTKFSIASLPAYKSLVANVLRADFESADVPEIFDFYDVFPAMLRYLTGEEVLRAAGIDLVVKTADNIRPVPELPQLAEPYQEFLALFDKTPLHASLEHHLAHAYQAYLCSPFENAAVLTVDGTGERLERVGDSLSTTFCVGQDRRIEVRREIRAGASVGGLYATVTRHLGFREEQEGNTMALAAFGSDSLYREFRKEFVLYPDGNFEFRIKPAYDGFFWIDRMRELCPRRVPGAPFEQIHKDLAWACQMISEEILVNAARGLRQLSGFERLAIAGGVGLNCVANAKILEQTDFREIYVMPNAGDRGLSAGCALYGYHVLLGGQERVPPKHDYLGRSYGEPEILTALRAAKGIAFRKSPDIAAEVAGLLARQRIVGWVQGGAEFGPRALGHRSILADPRTLESKKRLDSEIKRREWFRPYAPSVLREHAAHYFETRGDSPYMLLAVNTREALRHEVEGIVHVDGTARVQTVDRDVEPLYYRLIESFHALSGVPLVLNTSFNGYGDPMVETPEDALGAFHRMQLDALAVGDYIVERAGEDP